MNGLTHAARTATVTLMILPIVIACKTTPSPTAAVPSVDAPPHAGSEAPAVAITRETITLNPDEITVDETAGTLIFSPGSRVRSATYTHYILQLSSVEVILGSLPLEPISVIIEITKVEEDVHIPDSPMAASPEGGFQITKKTGRVVAVAG